MDKEIEKLLDRLERIDHKKYCCDFEFADSSSFDEVCMCFEERKILANYVKELQQENKQLKERVEYLERSNNRREETIIEERKEISDLEERINNQEFLLKSQGKELKELYSIIDKAIEYLEHFDSGQVCEEVTEIAKYLEKILKGEIKC